MADSGIRTRWRSHICINQGTNGSAIKSARHGQFQEKEKNADYWIEYFPFEKKILTENNDSIYAAWYSVCAEIALKIFVSFN